MNPNSVIKAESVAFFLLCSLGLFIFGKQCVDKYFSFPQSVEIIVKEQNEFELPTFTFCPFPTYVFGGKFYIQAAHVNFRCLTTYLLFRLDN